MRYSVKTEAAGGDAADAIRGPLETVLRGLGLDLIELHALRRKGGKAAPGSAQVRVVVYKPGAVGTNDCQAAHRAIMPRLELAFPGLDLYVEVSSPGIDRLIKDGAEFTHYRGRAVRCYRTDISDWTAGIVVSADESGIELNGKEGSMWLNYEIIGKAKLDSALPVDAVQED